MVCLAVCVHGDSWSPGGPTLLLAQEGADAAQAPEEPSDEGSRWASYGMGLAIGAAGFGIGAMIGTLFEESCQELECFDEAFWMGSALGAVGAGAGVHLGNGSRGNVWLTLLTSVGTGMVGAAVAVGIDDDPGSAIVAVSTVVVQMIATTEVERASGRARARSRRAAEASAGSDDSGGPGALYRSAADRGIRLSLGLSPTVRRGEPGMALSGRLSF